MTIGLDEIDNDRVFEFLDWIKQIDLWDGREVEENLFMHLFSQKSPAEFDRMARALAEIGAGRQIEKIDLSECEAIPVGLRKSCSKFWKKHKIAILVGIAIVAIVTTVIVVTTVTGGAGGATAPAARVQRRRRKAQTETKRPAARAFEAAGSGTFKTDRTRQNVCASRQSKSIHSEHFFVCAK